MLAATVLFVPANALPVMNLVSFGQGRSDTIMSGVVELGDSGMWPLAALVFFASIHHAFPIYRNGLPGWLAGW